MIQTNIIEDLTLLPLPQWWENPWILAAMAVGAVTVLWLLWKYAPRPAPKSEEIMAPPGPPEDAQALDRLAALRQRLNTLDHYAVAIEVSEILRDYVSARFGLPVRFQTTREFLEAAVQNAALNSNHRNELGRFLGFCDLVKFARGEATHEDQTRLLDTAESFVRSTARSRSQP